jgi:hypothetical protein
MKYLIPLALISILLGGVFYFYPKKETTVISNTAIEGTTTDLTQVQNAEEEEGEVETETTEVSEPSTKPQAAATTAKAGYWKTNQKLSDREKASIDGYMNLFGIYSGKYQKQPDALLKQLGEIGLKPKSMVDKNPHTGGMLTIRTQNALAGTRYFHAQFQKDENNEVLLQHMSVEFRKSSETFDSVVKQVKAQFPKAKQKKSRNKQFAEFATEDGYNIWVKVLAREDLENDPDNAYTPEDVGTVRFVVEQDIH